MQIQVNPEGMDLGQKTSEIRDRSTQAINAPGHHDIELPARGCSAQGIELRAQLAILSPADPLVSVDGYDFAAHARSRRSQLPLLVHRRLLISRDSQIQRGGAHGVPSLGNPAT